ncbi:hypothetical protein M501DRAFT_878755 [Patellaria atrata CBS 101060]|uniref:Uncharacterized protein n=1 Tax=Patellaria atrata CBS 101060 TaxID=1346257 RepID=A0A9P4SAX1_9PEZI|nr:hypothetical protein M501DRAFT_878755 [Patellaria atrata CBS 101060]
MPGNQFLDPSMFKEDEESLTSLDDSTYMSQPDTNRRAAGAQANIPYQFTQEPRPNMTDNFQAQSTYSPSLSAESQGKYPQQAHLTAMLPSAAQEYDLDPAFKVSNTTNFNQEQYTRQTFSHTRFYPESNELGLDETLWSASDLQKYSSPFAVGSTGATAFMSQPQDFSARHGDNPTFFQPYPQYHSDDTSRQVSFSQFPNEQKRPRLPLTTNLSSVSLPSPLRRSSSATVSKSETHPQFSRKSSQASIALATPTIDSVMLSPASSTMGSQRQGGRLNRDNHAQSQAFFDVVE